MKPASFDYRAPDSLDAALALKAEHGDEAKFLAGGQSLVPAMNFRLVQAALLVDINPVRALEYVRRDDDGTLRLGALTRHRTLERHALIRQHAPLVSETAPHIAHPQIRNRGTLGGSLVHADPAAELPVITVALGARFKLQSVDGERWVNAQDFFQSLFTVDITPQEMLTEVALPPRPARTGAAFSEFARRSGDYALMGVAAVVTLDAGGRCESARLVYLNAGEIPMQAAQAAESLKGQMPSPTMIDSAARLAAETEISPLGNVHASAEYQRHLARVLTKRALSTAFERAAAA